METSFQSEQERLLRKHMRKEEKRQARRDREGAGALEDHTSHLRALGFDPEAMRKERYAPRQLSSLKDYLPGDPPSCPPQGAGPGGGQQ